MPTLETLLLFFGSSVLLALSPGPDIFYVLSQAVSHGRRAGAWVTFGLCSGLIGHTTLVAVGVGQWLSHSPQAFLGIRIAGGVYLLTLCWQAWRAGFVEAKPGSAPALSAAALYRRGVAMNLSNPKVTLFFLAFLPQFVDPSRADVTLQVVTLGAVFATAGASVFLLVAALAGSLGARLAHSPRIQRGLHRGAAVVFAALAVRLFFG